MKNMRSKFVLFLFVFLLFECLNLYAEDLNIYQNNHTCRICQKNMVFLWERLIKDQFIGSYYQCQYCKSIQIADPFWLAETYLNPLIYTYYDQGRYKRNKLVLEFIENLKEIKGISEKLNILDYGAGEGILRNFSNDNVYNYDPYFNYEDLEELKIVSFDIIICIEVLEHLVDVQEFIKNINLLKNDKTILICSTELLDDKNIDSNWYYFIPHIGTHVTFWTKKSFEQIQKELNYEKIRHQKKDFLFFHILFN